MSQLNRPSSAASVALSQPVTSDKPFADLTLHAGKQCKGSVRYETNDPDAPVTSIYVSRKWADRMPESIVVTLTAK